MTLLAASIQSSPQCAMSTFHGAAANERASSQPVDASFFPACSSLDHGTSDAGRPILSKIASRTGRPKRQLDRRAVVAHQLTLRPRFYCSSPSSSPSCLARLSFQLHVVVCRHISIQAVLHLLLTASNLQSLYEADAGGTTTPYCRRRGAVWKRTAD